MIYLEDLTKFASNHPLRANASTDDFWSLTDKQKEKATVQTTRAAIVDPIVKDKNGEWAIRNWPSQSSDRYYDVPVPKEKCSYKYFFWKD